MCSRQPDASCEHGLVELLEATDSVIRIVLDRPLLRFSSHCNPRATGSAVSIGTVSGPKPAGMGDSDLFLTHSRKLACNAWQHVTDRHVVGGRPDRHRHPRRALGVLAGVAALSLPRGIESPMIPNGCQSCGTGTKYTTLFSACFHTLPEARALSVQYTFFARR